MRIEAKTYREAGVTYCIPPFAAGEYLPFPMKRFSYDWLNLEYCTRGNHHIYTSSLTDMNKLISHWNAATDKWVYSDPYEVE